MNILIIEDNSRVKSSIEDNLRIIGIDPHLDHIIPNNESNIEELLPKNEDLNKYDLALVDLELDPFIKKKLKYCPEDLEGGTKILPYLRKVAPWLPVIAESRLFSHESEYFLAIAGSFGFDGYLPNEIFISDSFNRELWDIIYFNALMNRRRSIIKCDFHLPNKSLNIMASNQIKKQLNDNMPLWNDVLESMFYFCDKITIEPISGGYSGAVTFRVKVENRNLGNISESNWLLKLSNNIFKLNIESKSHIHMMLNGLEYARSVPLLWRGAIVSGRTAGIAYQFASSTDIALSKCNNYKSTIKTISMIKDMIVNMYKQSTSESNTILTLILQWYSVQDLKDIVSGSKDDSLIDSINNMLDGNDNMFDRVLYYKKCWIHGDLHLRNILLGDRNVFIDFAKSKVGPVVIDLAKLAYDLLINVNELRTDEFPSIKDGQFKITKIMFDFNNDLKLDNSDFELYDLFLKFYLLIALKYDDVTPEAKEWINSLNI